MHVLFILAFLLCLVENSSKTYYSVTSVAGRGHDEGENVAPTSSYVDNPLGVWGDKYGRIYFTTDYRIRRISSSLGIVATVAGNGISQDSNIGSFATDTSLHSPLSLFVTSNGTIYIGDYLDNGAGDTYGEIRKVDLSGILLQFCGIGFFTDDNRDALQFSLQYPEGIWGDSVESIYIVDQSSVFKVKNGLVNRVAGQVRINGDAFDGQTATTALLSSPTKVWVDTQNGMYIIQDNGVRKVDGTTNIINRYAGAGSNYDDNVKATAAGMLTPECIIGYQNDLYICTGVYVKKISTSTTLMKIVAGGGDTLVSGYSATSVLMEPMGVWFDTTGVWYIADSNNKAIMKVNSNIVTVIAGGNSNFLLYSGDGGTASFASLNAPQSLWVNTVSDIFVGDTLNYVIRKVDHSSQIITTFAGNAEVISDFHTSGPATSMSMGLPYSIWGDSACSALYVADNSNNVIISISIATGYASVFAGNFAGSTSGSGKATAASILFPRSLIGDTVGRLYFSQDQYIRRIDTSSIISVVAGSSSGDSTIGIKATAAALLQNYNMWVNTVGDFYFWDMALKKVSVSSGLISVFVGSGGFPISDGVALSDVYIDAAFWTNGIWGDTNGVLYLSDNYMAAVYSISTSSEISVMAGGTGFNYYDFDSHDALSAKVELPKFVMVDSVGSCYFAEKSRIRKLTVNVPSYAPTSQPSNPSGQPSRQPTSQPSRQPTRQPTVQPSSQPSRQPSSQPSVQPTSQPSARPTMQPSNQPSTQPSAKPSRQPSRKPSSQPSCQPTSQPSAQPSRQPSMQPSQQPSSRPTSQPSVQPSVQPSRRPSAQPSNQPSSQPSSRPSRQPSAQPTMQPSSQPVSRPSNQPSTQPSSKPSCQPSSQPSIQPTRQPTSQPSSQPSTHPTACPSIHPLTRPTCQPTRQPQSRPTNVPSRQPSAQPTGQPSSRPSNQPTGQPSAHPTRQPSMQPSLQPTVQPIDAPSSQPTDQPSTRPSSQPSRQPSLQPVGKPSSIPSRQPSLQPSSRPSTWPSHQPLTQPTRRPSVCPSGQPSRQPSSQPSEQPSNQPSMQPVRRPSSQPSRQPSSSPSQCPSGQPVSVPSSEPSIAPTSFPTCQPSIQPSRQPSSMPSATPSRLPSNRPSTRPSCHPSKCPSSHPSAQPADRPSSQPIAWPSNSPSRQPTCHPSIRPSHCPSAGPSISPSHQPAALPSCRPSGQPLSSPSGTPSSRPSAVPLSVPSSQPSWSFSLRFWVSDVFASNISMALEVKSTSVVSCAAFVQGATPVSTAQIQVSGVSVAIESSGVVALTGLVGFTDYKVYCFAQSSTNSENSLSSVLAKGVNVTTACCRQVVASISSTILLSGHSTQDFLTLSFVSRPLAGLSATFFVSNGTKISGAMVPSHFDFSSQSSLISKTSLISLPPGSYVCVVSLSGNSAEHYSFGSDNLQVTNWSVPFTVQRDYIPNTPVFTSAVFSNDGTYVIASFDSNTDKGNTSTYFSCSRLFNFSCVAAASCQWLSPSVVNVFVPPENECAAVGSTFSILSTAVILADCSGGCSRPSSRVVPKTVVIAPPVLAISPTVIVSAPVVIGACDSLTLDLTASTGHGGRSWSKVQILAQNLQSSAGLQSFLDNEYILSPPSAISESLLLKNTTYTFVVTLCNFLGKCSSLSYPVKVLPGHVPVILIGGPLSRNVLRKNELAIGSRAAVSTCSGLNVTSGLTYSWDVSVNGVIQSQLTSTSLDLSKMRLPAYSLSVGVLYTMALTVTYEDTHRATSANVMVYVQQGAIVAILSSGSSLSVMPGVANSIDAAGSYDEDVNGVTPGLTFLWSCIEMSPSLASNCDLIFDVQKNLTEIAFRFTARQGTTNSTAVVTVAVSDLTSSRSGSAAVTVLVTDSGSPIVTVSSSAVNGMLTGRQSLILTGSVVVPAASKCNATWSVNDSSIDLKTLAQTPISVQVVSSVVPVTRSAYLLVTGSVLPTFGWTGAFTLTCRLLSGRLDAASIIVSVNAAPVPGSFMVSSANGTEGYWLFSANRWTDADLPLQYQFGFVGITGSSTVLLSKTEFTYGTALIPPGLPSLNYSVPCFVSVFDSLLNAATATRSVPVLPTSLTIESLLSNTAITLDQSKQTAAYLSNLLNVANCTMSPNCTSLNRAACSVTPNTCGGCLNGFIGDLGNANSPCFSRTQTVFVVTGAPKACPSNCSYHGVCQYVSVNTGLALDDCRVGNSQCIAQCECVMYSYGIDCSKTVSQMDLIQSARNQVINLIAGLLRKEDADEQTVEAWISSMSDATVVQSELDSTAIQSIFNASTSYLSLGYAVGVSTVSTLGVLSSVDNAAAAAKRNGVTGSSVGNAVGNLLLQFETYASVMMVSSQVALQLIYSQFRTVIDVPSLQDLLAASTTADASSDVTASVSETIPLTELEVVQNQPSVVVVAPLSTSFINGTSLVNSNTSVVRVSINAVAAAVIIPLANASVLSNVITATYSVPPDPMGVVNLTIPFTQPQLLVITPPLAGNEVSNNLTCALGSTQTQNYTCADGTVVINACNGTEIGIKSQQCPVVYTTPVCSTVSGTLIDSSECSVMGFTNSSVSCSCPVASNASVIQNDGSYSVNYVVMLKTVEKSFVSTLSSAQGLNEDTLTKCWKCLTTLGVFVGFVIVALLWSNFMDSYESEFNSKMSAKVSPRAMAAKNSWIHMQKRLTNNKLMQIRSGNKGFQRNRDLMMIEGALPQIFRSQGMSQKVIKELKQHHRWFAIVFFYCKYFPRVLRVVSLFTNIVIMLFIQSLTYNLTNADNGTCETLHSETACLYPRSPYATGESKCRWTADGSCKYASPGGNVKIIVFVAIFSALISTPLALLVDWVVNHILAAPTEVRMESSRNSLVVPVEGFARMADLESAVQHTRARTRTRTSSGDEVTAAPVTQASKMVNLALAQKTLRVLTVEMQTYRAKLSEEHRKDFDSLWGLDASGQFFSNEVVQNTWFKKAVDVKKMVLEDLQVVIASTNSEKQRFLREQTGDARGKRMLYLFQKDLLPGIQGQMLDAKAKRDNVQPKSTRRVFKYLAWIFIALLNLGMLFYILLFALNQNNDQQTAWFQSFMLWLCLEIFLVSTAIALLTHVLIPLWTMKDVNRIKQILLNSLSEFRENIVQKHGQTPRAVQFNAAQYLFVSSQLAKEFPKLKESKIIARFSTPWPKRSYQHVSDVSKQYSKKFSAIIRSLGLVAIYFMTSSLTLPPHLQDLVLHSITTISFGYIFLVHVELFRIFPLLAFVPLILCMVAMHFWINAGRATALKDLHVLQRRRQSTVLHSQSKDSQGEEGKVVTTTHFLAAGQVERQHLTRRQSIREGFVTIDQLKALHTSEDEDDDFSESEAGGGGSDGSEPSVGNILEWGHDGSSSDDSEALEEGIGGAASAVAMNDEVYAASEEGFIVPEDEANSVGTDVIDQLLHDLGEEKVTEDEWE